MPERAGGAGPAEKARPSLDAAASGPKIERMYRVTVRLAYPWVPQLPEEREVSFVLAGEYACTSPEEAREVVLRLIATGEPGFVLDAEGVPWPFYRETVREVEVDVAG